MLENSIFTDGDRFVIVCLDGLHSLVVEIYDHNWEFVSLSSWSVEDLEGWEEVKA